MTYGSRGRPDTQDSAFAVAPDRRGRSRRLPRVGVVSGASVYPFAWNVLLAARHEGFGGTITTLAVAQEPKVQDLLGLPRHVAVAAVMPLGRPVKQLTTLRRKAVAEFTMRERWGGPPLTPPTP